MPKVFLICGKICCGKSTYAEKLRLREKAVLLSCDEITLALFAQQIGEKHDEIVERTQAFLYRKAVEVIQIGTNVILDWGFWMKEERDAAKAFFAERHIACEFHYIDISDATWRSRLQKRNNAIVNEGASAYFVDDALAAKFGALFEMPQREEMDVWLTEE